ncbi:arabinofuranosidase catalytic domain-containing protein [Pedobacter frigoris]|uniref:arabinofuranosidase catalytic domain-containing protein n=1 Tax=Pedobacter frigoris TaxID=2571272 RepID=UPI00292E2191|nr:arabinofuranosidase catalytic domain-containing protein [Pedobacter frigoris]
MNKKTLAKICLYLILVLGGESMVFAQNTLDKVGLDGSSLAQVAYSFRKLSTSFSGYAIQVRRSNDNATQDIGFTSGGDFDAAALIAFVGANSGYVTIWYDQSGNGKNLSQPTGVNQPRIVNAGSIDTENGKPFIRFYGHDVGTDGVDYLRLDADMNNNGHVSLVNRFAVGGYGFVLGHTGSYQWHSDNGGNRLISSSLAATPIRNSKVWQNRTSISPLSAIYNTKLMVNTIVPQSTGIETRWNNIGTDRLLYHDTNLGAGYAELIVFGAELLDAARTALIESQVSYYNTVITDRLLNRNGQLTPSLPDQINQNGARGLSGLLRTGEKIAY